VALVTRRTRHPSAEVGARADAVRADVRRGAGVAVVARGPVRRVRVRADARGRTARPRHVTLIARRAGDRVGAGADARLTAIALRARITVGAARPVRRARIRAGAGCRITRPGHVTLIARRADDRVGSRADARLAGVALRA